MTAPTSEPGVAAVVVLAAGAGTRMKSRTSKLLHEVAGRTLLSCAVDAARAVSPERLVVVVGHQREQVQTHLSEIAPDVTIAVQEQPNGTGDAVRSGLVPIPDVQGEVVVTMGDVPMLSGETLAELVATHRRHGDAATVLTTVLDDAGSYGRVVRDADGQVTAIVERKDCTPEQVAIREINAGIYVFDADVLRAGLASLTTDNAQGELYLTDVIRYARSSGGRVHPQVLTDAWQAEGINDRVQLAAMGKEVNRRICERWMRAGVTIVDPDTTWIEDTVSIEQDVTLLPGTHLRGATTIKSGARVGPDTTLVDVEVDEDATVTRSDCTLALIGARATVGPYALLRPGSELGEEVRLGTFVETKNARVGRGAKIPHVAYVGDAEVGAEANIGPGVVFGNYDGAAKHHTEVGRGGFIGAGAVLLAPVTVADGAYVAGGSVITDDVARG
ncbi:bifunctional UDP-N-acetylglucosamine diphosphorylase/glucosamine-1-phosphate N-acetyltransferase GlmU [Nigerium massiliense]|uniref:bifunctional UDP-N-acetylglucosamine diphosphorylase/glucosamine-1-phosphate N-acetyltransferase GlmU n=1 Tax=Nigerium massiliense TaxID=1522317 RepID=UPI000AD18A03|nr:bifunctional UDP-N-acetylglucosamine diphosphorylase/glucosamine-1-phosphate N-acetyltransferase GlmU [Nigerium massiliense]